jgi:hypothetical protein
MWRLTYSSDQFERRKRAKTALKIGWMFLPLERRYLMIARPYCCTTNCRIGLAHSGAMSKTSTPSCLKSLSSCTR